MSSRIYQRSFRPTISVVFVIAFLSCTSIVKGQTVDNKNASMKKTEWLVGLWENKRPKGSTFERWGKAGESGLKGKSYMIKEKDTVVFENIRLVQQNDGVFYIPTVKDQNKGKEVPFKATSLTSNEMVFENPQHDFPQKITYTKISQDSLIAEISGTINGKLKSQKFAMKRIQ